MSLVVSENSPGAGFHGAQRNPERKTDMMEFAIKFRWLQISSFLTHSEAASVSQLLNIKTLM